MKLRTVMQALQNEGYARKFKIPPDNLGDRNLRMPCLNPGCPEKASANFGKLSTHGRMGVYNCPHCGLRDDAMALIIALVGEALDPYEELNDTGVVAQAHVWAESYAGAERTVKAEDIPRPRFVSRYGSDPDEYAQYQRDMAAWSRATGQPMETDDDD